MTNKKFEFAEIKEGVACMTVGINALARNLEDFMDEPLIKTFFKDADKMFNTSNSMLDFLGELEDKNGSKK